MAGGSIAGDSGDPWTWLSDAGRTAHRHRLNYWRGTSHEHTRAQRHGSLHHRSGGTAFQTGARGFGYRGDDDGRGLASNAQAAQAVRGNWFASGGHTQARVGGQGVPAGAGVPASVRQQQQARQKLDRTVVNLGRTAAAIAAQQVMQEAARAAARGVASDAPDGYTAGGLWDKDAAGNDLAWIGADRLVQRPARAARAARKRSTSSRRPTRRS